MRLFDACILALLAAASARPQSADPGEPSPMEAFAKQSATRVAWSNEIGRLEYEETRVLITALTLEDNGSPSKRIRGVRLDLANPKATDEIYLDEEAINRTIKALGESSEGMARAKARNLTARHACFGAAAFWPLYNWPWNKYHELNANYCISPDGTELVLSGRHEPGSYHFLNAAPEDLAKLLQTALDQLKSH